MGPDDTNKPADGVPADSLLREILAARKDGPLNERVDSLSPSQVEKSWDLIHGSDESPPPPDATAESRGHHDLRLEGYRLVREISRGGQATVYEGWQISTGRRVAIKVIAGGPYASSRSRRRFDREVRVLATLAHPGIVGVFDRGRTVDGSLFFAMDYVEGYPLDAYLKSRCVERASLAEVVELFGKILDALDDAHRRGICHRDIKPSNVRVDARGTPHVLDFGLARIADPAEHNGADRHPTVSGNIVGSMPWSSPEQATGNLSALEPPTDVYSLAVVMYEAVTGEAAYPVVGPIYEVIRHICKTTPRPPSALKSAPFGRVPDRLSRVLLKAMAKAPGNRYATAAPFAQDLRRSMGGGRLLADDRSSIRRRRSWAVVGGVGVSLLAAAVTISRPWPSAEPYQVEVLSRRTNKFGMEFVQLRRGAFSMGSGAGDAVAGSDEDSHPVLIRQPFWMSVSEVTRGQYKAVMGGPPPGVPDADPDFPVDHVSYADALRFCETLSRLDGADYRLPTEAEWEYACRAGTRSPYAGNGKLADMGWFAGNSGGQLHPVKSRLPNQWGLFDMHGGVSEWCLDGYHGHLGHREQIDPFVPHDEIGAVVRGGNFTSNDERCRSAARTSLDQGTFVGIRLVIAPTPRAAPYRP